MSSSATFVGGGVFFASINLSMGGGFFSFFPAQTRGREDAASGSDCGRIEDECGTLRGDAFGGLVCREWGCGWVICSGGIDACQQSMVGEYLLADYMDVVS